jgi:D-tyrosyl-tRNA(Tyr) deacylase
MRVVIQRVNSSQVSTKKITRKIGKGLLVFVGVEDLDDVDDINWLCKKISGLRIFDDENGVMNLSVKDVSGEIMVISQFTLHASTKKGNRPSWIRASKPEQAIEKYNSFVNQMEVEFGKPVVTGEFQEQMLVDLKNDGPVTIFIDTKNKE